MPRLLQGKLNYSSISPFYASEIPGLIFMLREFPKQATTSYKLQLATSYKLQLEFLYHVPHGFVEKGLLYVFYERPDHLYSKK